MTAPRRVACVIALLLLMAPVSAPGQDDDRRRVYLGLRVGDSNPALRADDTAGLSLGVNLGRFLSVELAADFYEVPADVPGLGVVGEYGFMALGPHLRLRYPLFGGQLSPYVLVGVGIGVGQFNDRKPPGFGLSISRGDVAPVATVGAGLEYFLADNIAVGLEGKYVVSGRQSLTVDGRRHPMDVDEAVLSASLRLFYPEARPPVPATADGVWPGRVYLGIRIGGALPAHAQVFPGVRSTPEPPAWAGRVDQLFGASVGVNLGRYLGVEVPFEGYEMGLVLDGRGTIGEYAWYAAIPVLRLRSTWLEDRLEVYALGGVGLTYAEFNDGKPAGAGLEIRTKDYRLAGALGGGVEYFVTSNIAIGIEAKYVASHGHELRIEGQPTRHGRLDAVLVSAGLRVFLGTLGR